MNGRLYRSLREKADELQELTEYNENILESMDSGHPGARPGRPRRALEPGAWRRSTARRRDEVLGRALDDVFPASFLEALRGSLVLGRPTRRSRHIYKLHLPTAGRAHA